MKAGVAIKPKTSVDELLEVMRKCNNLKTRVQNALVMTVEPGFGGQKFMGDMMPKVEAIRREFTGLLKKYLYTIREPKKFIIKIYHFDSFLTSDFKNRPVFT